MNLKTIADNLAARFTGVTATNGAATEAIAVGPTASLPNGIAKGPALLVYHPVGELEVGVSALRHDAYTFPVRLLRDPMDYATRSDWLYAWANAMRDRVEMDMDLGLTYVSHAEPVAMRVELDGEEYAGVTYDVVDLSVLVTLWENVTTAAP